jgi:HptB-dependent secretion and biofilm anti anti-sigma factor
MEYAFARTDGQPVATLSGRVVYADAGKMHDILAKWDFAASPTVRLNLRFVTFIDSTAIGTLFVIAKHAADAGGELILLHPAASVMNTLERAQLQDCARIVTE